MRKFHYIYYRFYRLAAWLKMRDPEECPFFIIPIVLTLNSVFVKMYFGIGGRETKTDNIIFVAICFFTCFTSSILFDREKLYMPIIEKYKGESKTKNIVCNIIVLIYIVTSFF